MNRLNFEENGEEIFDEDDEDIFDEDEGEIFDDIQDAEYLMEVSMSLIHKILIKPNQKNISPHEREVLETIGKTLKQVAYKARAYELIHGLGELHPDYVN